MRLIFVGQGYPQKLFNLEHFPINGIPLILKDAKIEIKLMKWCAIN